MKSDVPFYILFQNFVWFRNQVLFKFKIKLSLDFYTELQGRLFDLKALLINKVLLDRFVDMITFVGGPLKNLKYLVKTTFHFLIKVHENN